jgi:hypothetical protein
MAVSSQKPPKVILWCKLRRLAFRFDGKTKALCFAGFIIPGLPAIDHPQWVYLSAFIGLAVLAVVPVLLGLAVAREIESRFGKAVLDRALYHCVLGRYMRNKMFTIGEIQSDLEAERQAGLARAAQHD